MTQNFIKGLDLSEIFYRGTVAPLLEEHFPALNYSAALIGHGSEILGFDTPQSTDHDWGPRLMLFFQADDHAKVKHDLNRLLRKKLPKDIEGYPTNFIKHDSGSAFISHSDEDEINHRIDILTAEDYFNYLLQCNPMGELNAVDWVKIPAYRLLMATSGRVFHDGLNQLDLIRQKLAYYPHDVWLYLLAAQWARIEQEEHFMGRCGQVGDDLGSRLVAGRLVSDMMRLCFLMERRYPAYIKWYGSAFSQLECADTLKPIFTRIFQAATWEDRQVHSTAAYEFVARMHNRLKLTDEISVAVSSFHERPFLVIHAHRFAAAIYSKISDKSVLQLPRDLGSIDQFVDSTDALHYLDRFASIYE